MGKPDTPMFLFCKNVMERAIELWWEDIPGQPRGRTWDAAIKEAIAEEDEMESLRKGRPYE